jgi:hypothetical protein
MDSLEISIARAYLAASGQDPVTALIRSVKDLARTRRLLADAQAGALPDCQHAATGAYSAACAGALANLWPTSWSSSFATSARIS